MASKWLAIYVCEIPFVTGDRFLLHTDGVSEPENAASKAFADHRLEQLLRDNPVAPRRGIVLAPAQ